MDKTQFERLCRCVWQNTMGEMEQFFRRAPDAAENRATWHARYAQLRAQHGVGALVVRKDLGDVLLGQNRVEYGWLSARGIELLCGARYHDALQGNAHTNDAPQGDAYILPLLFVSGSSEYFAEEYVFPRVRTYSCLARLVHDGSDSADAICFEPPQQWFAHSTEIRNSDPEDTTAAVPAAHA